MEDNHELKPQIFWETDTRGILVINECIVPYILIVKHISPENDGLLSLVLNNRYSIDIIEDELDKWGWWIANAMAISAGYSCHGSNIKLNPHAIKTHIINTIE